MRGRRSLRDFTLLVWLLTAIVVAVIHRWVPESTWLMVHLIALGAITHSLVVWSSHFTAALLRTRPDGRSRRVADIRSGLLAVGALLVFIGVPTATWWLTLAGALLVSAMVLWHGFTIVRDLRRALPGRFRVTMRYYLAAAALMPVGAGFGTTLAWGLSDRWHANFLVAHTMTMILGWVGLTLVGTLVTFWPTVLRTRMDDRAEALARQALPILLAGIAVTIGGSVAGVRPVAAVGIVIYAVGLVWFGRCLIAPLKNRPPREFAPASILAGALWACVAIVATAVHVWRADDISLATNYSLLAGIWVAGFLLQLITGALSYLLPSAIGGGPRVVRAAAVWFDKWTAARLTVINGGILLFLLPIPSWAKVTVSTLVMVALALFLPLMIAGMRAAALEKRAAAAGEEPSLPPERANALTGSGLVAGIAALAVAMSVGFGMDPGAAGLATPTAATAEAVAPTGQTVRVEVAAVDMRFEPSSVRVNPGDHVIIELTNTDPTNVHDLMVGDVRSPRIAAGETAELDLGIVGQSIEGWCTVVGHRQMGMTFDVLVGDDSVAAPQEPDGAGHSMDHGVPAAGDPDAVLGQVVDDTVEDILRAAGTDVADTAAAWMDEAWKPAQPGAVKAAQAGGALAADGAGDAGAVVVDEEFAAQYDEQYSSTTPMTAGTVGAVVASTPSPGGGSSGGSSGNAGVAPAAVAPASAVVAGQATMPVAANLPLTDVVYSATSASSGSRRACSTRCFFERIDVLSSDEFARVARRGTALGAAGG